MSQEDCQIFLQEQRKKHPNKWFRVKDIQEGLKQKGLGNGTLKNVPQALYKLMRWGDIEWKGVGIWKHHKEFRGKKE